jgi:hypothetical protein
MNDERICILQEIIKTNIILDLLGTIFFSCFIKEYLICIPFLLLSYYGNKKCNLYILTMYQIKIIVSININIYLFYAEKYLWLKVAYITYNPILFWYLNTVWTLCFYLRLEESRISNTSPLEGSEFYNNPILFDDSNL